MGRTLKDINELLLERKRAKEERKEELKRVNADSLKTIEEMTESLVKEQQNITPDEREGIKEIINNKKEELNQLSIEESSLYKKPILNEIESDLILEQIHNIQRNAIYDYKLKASNSIEELKTLTNDLFEVLVKGNSIINEYSKDVPSFRKVIGSTENGKVYSNDLILDEEVVTFMSYIEELKKNSIIYGCDE